jgi:hypothetical protein
MMIMESFDLRTLYHMEIALDRACQELSLACEFHDARRYVAGKILECAQRGDQSVDGLTEAGRVAANDFCATRGI